MNGHVQGFYTIQYFPCPCLEHAWCDLPDLVLNYQDLGNSLSIFIRRKTVIYYKSPTYKYTAIHCIPQGLHLVQGQGILHLLEKVIVWNPVRGSVLGTPGLQVGLIFSCLLVSVYHKIEDHSQKYLIIVACEVCTVKYMQF